MPLPEVSDDLAKIIIEQDGGNNGFCARVVQRMIDENQVLASAFDSFLTDLEEIGGTDARQITFRFICTFYYMLSRQAEINELETINGDSRT